MRLKIKQRFLRFITRLRGEEYIAKLNLEMHRQGKFKGVAWKANLADLRMAIPDIEAKTFLDFGCGPLGGLRGAFPGNTISHDPHVPEFSESPWEKPFDAVFSSDVLEHMTVPDVKAFTRHVEASKAEYVFLVTSTRAAGKHLSNGANAHLLIKPPQWWRRKLQDGLGNEFQLTMFKADLLREDVSFCFHRGRSSED